MIRAAVAGALLMLAGCLAPAPEKPAAPDATRAATAPLEDALIKTAVQAELLTDDPDAVSNVNVAVRDRVVTLRGTVATAKLRDELGAASERVVHVQAVQNELRVDPHARRLGQRIGDVALAARIETAITAEVGLQKVHVRVDRGVASLDGSVPDAKTKAAIVAAAHATTGVRNVVDRIAVAGP